MTFRTPTDGQRPVPGTGAGPHRHGVRLSLGGPEGNARLTGTTAAVLLVLLAVEGVTLMQLRTLITPHVIIGMVLVPFVVVKLASTGWRMVMYYRGASPYLERGAPSLLLRLLAPVLVVATLTVFASGIALLLVPLPWRDTMFFLHKASFVLWFGAMTVHVLGHIAETSLLATADVVARSRSQVRGVGARMWIQAAGLVVGILLAVLMVPTVGPWIASGGRGG